MKKKTIGLILVIAYLIQGVTMFAHAEERNAAPITDDVNYQVFKWLDMTTSEMDKLDEDSLVTRGQFAYVLAGILGYRPKDISNSNIVDVQDTIYEGAVDYLVKSEIMPTMPVNKFNPKDPVLYKEMLTAVITALGYMNVKDNAQDADAYAQKIASQIGLTKGISTKYDASLSAKDTFEFLKKAALTSICEIDGFSKNGANYTNKNGKSLIYHYSMISYAEGIVIKNGITAINGEESTMGRAKIGNINVLTKKFHGIERLIGRYVGFFYEDNKSTKVLRYAYEIENKNDIINISAEDLDVDNPEFSLNCIVYDNKSRSKKLKISLDADVIYNGVRLKLPTKADLAIKQGTLAVIDNDGDNKYDVIDIRTYDDYVVRGRSKNIIRLNGKSYDIEDYSEVRIYNSDGKLVEDFNGINMSSVVSVFESKAEKTYLEIVESLANTSATITGTDVEGNKTMYVTKEEKYFLSETFKKSIEDGVPGMSHPIVGKAYYIKLNFDNRIVAITELYEGQWQIAYCVGIKSKSDGIIAKLVMQDNSVFTPYFAEKLRINGDKIRSDDVMSDPVKYYYFFDSSDKPIRQPVHIKISEAGEVSEIETPVDRMSSAYGYDKTCFSKDAYFANGGYKAGSHHGIGMYTIRTTGIVIEDPHLGENDYYSTDKIEIKSVSSVAEGKMSECYIYDLDEAYVGDILVYKNNEESLEETTTVALIDKVTTVYDEDADDERSRLIHLYTQTGNELTLKEKKDGILPAGVKRGDVYKIAYVGEILSAASKIISLADDPAPYASGTVVDQKWADIFGYVYMATSDSVTVLAPPGYTATPQKLIGTALKGGTTALVYDLPNDEVYVGSWEDMITSNVPDVNGDITIDSHSTKVYIYRRWDYANGLIILKR